MPAQEFLGPTSHLYTSQRLRLHYVDWGNEEAPLLLLVHGGRDHCRSWDWIARELRQDWHVVAPDLRGHGDSDWSSDGNYGFSAYLYDLAQLVHQLADARPVTIVSHSLGSLIALRYAGLYPDTVRKLVAIEGTGAAPPERVKRAQLPVAVQWRIWIEERRTLGGRLQRTYGTFQDAVERMREANPELSDEQIAHLSRHAVIRTEAGTWRWKFDPYTRHSPPVDISASDRESLWRGITCPVLLAWGKASWTGNPDEDGSTALFANAQAVAFDGGHWLHHDCFDAFVDEVKAFL